MKNRSFTLNVFKGPKQYLFAKTFTLIYTSRNYLDCSLLIAKRFGLYEAYIII